MGNRLKKIRRGRYGKTNNIPGSSLIRDWFCKPWATLHNKLIDQGNLIPEPWYRLYHVFRSVYELALLAEEKELNGLSYNKQDIKEPMWAKTFNEFGSDAFRILSRTF